MNIKKEYEKFFDRKKNNLCVHDAEDVIAFAKHYQALQLLQTDVSISLVRAKKYARHQHFLGTQGKELVEFEDWKQD